MLTVLLKDINLPFNHLAFDKSGYLLVFLIICLQNAGIINPCIMLKIIPAYVITLPLLHNYVVNLQ